MNSLDQAQDASRPRPSISFIGAGRAAGALGAALQQAGFAVAAVYSRDPRSAEALAGGLDADVAMSPGCAALAAPLTIVAVPDGAIEAVAREIASEGVDLHGHGILHTAGSLGRDVLVALRPTGAAIGALHPLQALRGPQSAALLRGSLFALDIDRELRDTIDEIVAALGGIPVVIPPEQRALYHAAASLAGNAPLALVAAGAGLLAGMGVDLGVATAGLSHLLAGAAANAERSGDAAEALTGPVARGDAGTVSAHIEALAAADSGVLDLYLCLAQAMLELSGAGTGSATAAVVGKAARVSRQRHRRTAA